MFVGNLLIFDLIGCFSFVVSTKVGSQNSQKRYILSIDDTYFYPQATKKLVDKIFFYS